VQLPKKAATERKQIAIFIVTKVPNHDDSNTKKPGAFKGAPGLQRGIKTSDQFTLTKMAP
jgi:hypothetical protein